MSDQHGEHLNLSGMDDKGLKMEAVANHVLLVLTARIVSVVLAPIAVWFLTMLVGDLGTMKDSLATLNLRLAVMEERILLNTHDRYTGRDAQRDFSVRDERIKGVEKRVDYIERKVQ